MVRVRARALSRVRARVRARATALSRVRVRATATALSSVRVRVRVSSQQGKWRVCSKWVRVRAICVEKLT